MKHIPSNSHRRRGFTFVALAVTLGLAAIGLTQCRLVDGNLTGVDVNGAAYHGGRGRSSCVHRCDEDYKKCNRREDSRYCQAVNQCDRLKKAADRKACKDAEKKKHHENENQCKREKETCKKNCNYREGSGGGGR